MTSNINYTLYWSPTGAGAYPAEFMTGVNTYLEGLEHDSAGHQNVVHLSRTPFDTAGSAAGAGVRYSWQFNDTEGGLEPTTIEIEAPTLNHKFSSTGTYNVALTVFKPDGTSRGAGHTIKVGGPGPTVKITVATASPTAGQPIAFNGSESTDVPSGSIATFTWNFGDGIEGSGATPLHTYAAIGSYTAKLTVTGSDGLIAAPRGRWASPRRLGAAGAAKRAAVREPAAAAVRARPRRRLPRPRWCAHPTAFHRRECGLQPDDRRDHVHGVGRRSGHVLLVAHLPERGVRRVCVRQ
jgi:PKD domain